MNKVGILTYDSKHLKTEQIAINILNRKDVSEIVLFSQPFKDRKKRKILIQHRPKQELGIHTRDLSNIDGINFVSWDGKSKPYGCDYYIIGGAGIIPSSAIEDNKIINVHPGIIPSARGLDAFKWAIKNMIPIGISMHYIDAQVDEGTVIKIFKTPLFSNDTISTYVKRHYDLEINITSNFLDFVSYEDNSEYPRLNANMRMPYRVEEELNTIFQEYKKNFSYK